MAVGVGCEDRELLDVAGLGRSCALLLWCIRDGSFEGN